MPSDSLPVTYELIGAIMATIQQVQDALTKLNTDVASLVSAFQAADQSAANDTLLNTINGIDSAVTGALPVPPAPAPA